jgi:NAD(P)H dehydrogenase (quinone)
MNVLVIYAHPDAGESFNAFLLQRVAGALRPRHDVRVLDLYASNFEPRLDEAEWRSQLEGTQPAADLTEHIEALRWCHRLVFIYPTWWSGAPSMLKGWFDRVWVRGVAYDVADSGKLHGLLTNIKRVAVVTTHGSSKIVNVAEGEVGKQLMQRSLGPLMSRRRLAKWLAFYKIDRSTNQQRMAFVAKVERYFARW